MFNVLPTAKNFAELVQAQANRYADRAILRFVGNQDDDEVCVTYADLDLRARAIAAHLQAANATGERALLLHSPGIEYVEALLGCLYAGVIAVPAYPPRMNRSADRLRGIAVDARARFGLTSSRALERLVRQQENPSELTQLKWIATDQCSSTMAAEWRQRSANPDDLALLQYTSGSTSAPKGVAVSHANLLCNVRSLAELKDAYSEDHFVSWLPPYHDMGLIGATLLPLCLGTAATILAPTTFLQSPFRWLWAITRYGGTISGGPNFAYELCCRRISEAQKAMLDLRSWRVAFSGAERVRSETLDRFAKAFGSAGFSRNAFAPCYGLAEATLGVSFSALDTAPTIAMIDQVKLGEGFAQLAEMERAARSYVGCGKALPNCQVRVVDPESQKPLPDGAIGELWVSSPSVAMGYWEKPALSDAVFRARLAHGADSEDRTYLRTGDLGFMSTGEIFVTGRLKDLIVLRGVNYYPEDIEATTEKCHPRLRPGCGVAFSVEIEDEEKLVIVHEIDSPSDVAASSIVACIRNAVAEEHQLQVHDILLVGPGSVPKTSSGKLQRNRSREIYLSCEFEAIERSNPHSITTTQTASSQLTNRVAELMAGILGLEKIASNDDFFWLGGHSLLATQLVSRIRDEFKVDLPLRAAFDAPTPRALAAQIAVAASLEQRGPTTRVDRGGHLPLSFSQERMWLLHQMDPASAAYNVLGTAVMEGPLDVQALRSALNELVQQQELLRTNYVAVEGAPVMRIAPAGSLEVEVIDLCAAPDRAASVRAIASSWASRPFDVARDLLIRAVLYRTGPHTHVACVCLHHLVTDAWSMGLLVRDVLNYYDIIVAGKTPHRREAALTYVDYAHWQREWLTPERLHPELEYWTSVLAGAEPVALPTDRPRTLRRSSAGATEPLALSAELFDSLKNFAAAEGTTPFMVMLAAFEVLLSRYTGSSDLVVGVPVANRNWLASEELMGTLVNTLALRVKFDPEETFRKLLQRVREVALDAYAHQDLPFERLISALPVERRLGESPLIRVMFDYQNAPTPGRSAGPLTIRPLMISRQASQFDLSLLIFDTELGRVASVEYSTELFDADTIRSLLSHYLSILESVALLPSSIVSQIPLLTAAERNDLVAMANRSCAGTVPVPDLLLGFADFALRTPDARAVIDSEGSLTYRELEDRATSLAKELRSLGAERGERVAICLDRNRDLVVAILATLKSGAAYVPLDQTFPAERIDLVLRDADVRILVTNTHIKETIRAAPQTLVLCLDSLQREIANRQQQAAPPYERPHESIASDPAYLIYTSGSTGRPKGVEISRGAVANFLRSMSHTPGIERGDRLLAVTTVAFDISVLELLLPLVSGATVYVAGHEIVADARRLLGLMTTYRPTVMQATPASWKMLLDAGWQGDSELKILCGGEALSSELARKLLARCKSLWNMYGPTETTVWSTVHAVTEDDQAAAVSIGTAIEETSIYVLDTNKQLLPRGVTGEIYIGGAGVANGYFRNVELTRERFISDPFLAETAGRLYRTGDLGRWRSDGTLEYLGRGDLQIKLRGFRIEPAEIESVIKESGRVRDVVVVSHEYRPGDARLVAYCIPSGAEVIDGNLTAELLESLRRKLPSYMIPSAFVSIAAFPQTANGKIDRASLPPPTYDRNAAEEEYVAPRDEVEAKLQSIWQDILAIPRVGIRDNFFTLGGHSLLAMKMLATIERTFANALPVSILFERSTIEFLAERLRNDQRCGEARSAVSTSASDASEAEAFSYLVPIQDQGTRPRLFCVHGAGGHVLNFWAISKHLGPDQPFYALQASGADGKQSPHEHLESMASAYLKELRTVQPHGPYYLSGYCGGGWIAFEMANRLRAAGEQVALLALLDSYGPNIYRPVRTLTHGIRSTLRTGFGALLRRARARLQRDYRALSHAVRIKYHGWLGRHIPYELRDVWLTRAFLEAAANYRPRAYDGKVTLLLARDVTNAASVEQTQFGWAGLARAGIQVFHMPGTHHTLTSDPNVRVLARTLARCMNAAEVTVGNREH